MNLQAQWIVGFVDGEGCFFVDINANDTLSMKAQVLPEFTVVQHKRDINVLYALKTYFKCGVVRVNHGDRMCFRVRGHENIMQNIIPFFEKHVLKTKKRLDFEKFRDIVLLMQQKKHLTLDGFTLILQIKQTMNSKAVHNNFI